MPRPSVGKPNVRSPTATPQASRRPRVADSHLSFAQRQGRPAVSQPNPQVQQFQGRGQQQSQASMNQFRGNQGIQQQPNLNTAQNQFVQAAIANPQNGMYENIAQAQNQPLNPIGVPQPPEYLQGNPISIDELWKMNDGELINFEASITKDHPLYWLIGRVISQRWKEETRERDRYWKQRHLIEDAHYEVMVQALQDNTMALMGTLNKTQFISPTAAQEAQASFEKDVEEGK